MGANAFEKVQDYSWDNYAKKIISLYQKVSKNEKKKNRH